MEFYEKFLLNVKILWAELYSSSQQKKSNFTTGDCYLKCLVLTDKHTDTNTHTQEKHNKYTKKIKIWGVFLMFFTL